MKRREGYRWQPRAWTPNPRQGAILDGLLQGHTNAAIGRAVGISADGVKWYVSQFLLETGLTNRHELAGWWRDRRTRSTPGFQGPTMVSEAEALSHSWPARPARPAAKLPSAPEQ